LGVQQGSAASDVEPRLPAEGRALRAALGYGAKTTMSEEFFMRPCLLVKDVAASIAYY
jgi:hypothetical protein